MSTIITTTDLNNYTGKTLVSSISTQVVAAVNSWIDIYTHRAWGVGSTPISVTERYDWKSPLWLRHMDVIAVQTVKLGYPNVAQQTIASNGYFVNPEGRLTMYFSYSSSISVRNNDLLEVTYTYGVLAVPDDLKLAALGIAATMYNYAKAGNQNIVASSVGSYRVQYAGSVRSGSAGPNPAMNTAEAFYAVVDSYRMRRF